MANGGLFNIAANAFATRRQAYRQSRFGLLACSDCYILGFFLTLNINKMENTKNTVVVYITDKHGCEMFKEYVHKDYTDSAKRDLQRHLDAAKKDPEYYHFLDVPTAEIKIKKID